MLISSGQFCDLCFLDIFSGVHSLVLFNDLAVSEWMRLLLPLAMERRICIITNMGASKRLISLNHAICRSLLYYFNSCSI